MEGEKRKPQRGKSLSVRVPTEIYDALEALTLGKRSLAAITIRALGLGIEEIKRSDAEMTKPPPDKDIVDLIVDTSAKLSRRDRTEIVAALAQTLAPDTFRNTSRVPGAGVSQSPPRKQQESDQ